MTHNRQKGTSSDRPGPAETAGEKHRRSLAHVGSVLLLLSLFSNIPIECRCETWNELLVQADSLSKAGNQESAIEIGLLALAAAEAESGACDTAAARVMSRLGIYYDLGGDYGAADSLCGQALDIFEKTLGENNLHVAELKNVLGNIFVHRGRYAEAEQLYIRALALSREIFGPEDQTVVKVIADMARLYLLQGEYSKAEPLYKQALPILERTLGPNDELTSSTRNGLAAVYMEQALYAEAEALFRQVVADLEAVVGPEHLSVSAPIHNLAITCKRQGRYSEAEELYKRALAITEKNLGPDHPSVARTLNSLLQLYIRQRRLDEAERLSERVQTIWNKVYGPDHPAPATSVYSLARLRQYQGRYVEAEELYKQALVLWEEAFGEEHGAVAAGLESYSDLMRMQGYSERALELAERACIIRRKNFLDNATVLSERNALSYAEYMQNSASNYLSCYLDAGQDDSRTVNAAANMIISTKGQVSDGIFERRQFLAHETDSTAHALAEALRLTRFKLSDLLVRRPADGVSDLAGEADSLGKLAGDLETQLSKQSPSFRDRDESSPVTTDEVRSALPDGSVLLEYRKYDYVCLEPDSVISRYLVVVVSGDGVLAIHDLGEAEIIDGTITEYRRHMLDLSVKTHMPLMADKNDYESIARKLFKAVLQPVERHLSGKNLVLISPDGGLNLISFSGLIDGDGRYLIERCSVHYLLSARELIRLKERRGSAQGLLAMGDPDYDASAAARMGQLETGRLASSDELGAAVHGSRPGWHYFEGHDLSFLPGTRAEVRSIVDRWRQSSSEPFVTFFGVQASEDVFKAEAPGKRIIHLATHGYCISGLSDEPNRISANGGSDIRFKENPLLRSGVFFAGANLHGKDADSLGIDDGVLTAYEVSAMDLHGTDMVVLSACETGLGEVQQGEGVYGLRRAFQVAGARTVISALWPIPDRETTSIMGDLYIATGETIPKKLRRVQLDLIARLRANHLADHPYSWAAFIALGDWR